MIILFDVAPVEFFVVAGLGIVIFFLLIFAAIVFIVYKLLKRKK